MARAIRTVSLTGGARLAAILVVVAAGELPAANVVRYGTDLSGYEPGNPATYQALTNATWADVNTALSTAINPAATGFVYVSGDVTGTGATDGPLRILGACQAFEFKGGFDPAFTGQDYRAKSVLNVNATSGSRSRALIICSTNVWVDGFVVRNGYTSGGSETGFTPDDSNACGAEIAAQAEGLRLSRLDVLNNVGQRNWGLGGGLFIHASGSGRIRLENLLVRGNTIQSAASDSVVRGGGIYVNAASPTECRLTVALCHFDGNVAKDTNSGANNYVGIASAIGLEDMSRPSSGTNWWVVFGCLFSDNGPHNADEGRLSVALGAPGRSSFHPFPASEMVLANCTLARNDPWGVSGTWRSGNSVINTVLSDNDRAAGYETYVEDKGAVLRFQHCLIDSTSPVGDSSTNGFFGAFPAGGGTSEFVDLGGNQQVGDAQLVDPTGADGKPFNDYMLQESSAGFSAGLARYSGSGFAFVDVNRNGAYDPGLDVIVDIPTGSGYVPAANEHYYPFDLNGNKWVGKRRYSSDVDLAGSMNIGAYGAVPPPKGTVVMVK